MTVDYDLVIIGGGPAGRYAAVAATQLKARVALVEPPQSEVNWTLSNQALVELGRAVHQSQSIKQFEDPLTDLGQGTSIELDRVAQWIETVVSTLSEQHSLAVLAGLGIEVILGQGQFNNQARLGFTVNGRQLQARAYIIATGIHYAQPDVVGLQGSQCLTPTHLIQKHWSQWPNDLVVVGGGPVSTELSQAFTRLGSRVTLIVSNPQILPQEDPEAAFWVQAHLEAEGVRVLTQTHMTQVRQVNGKMLVLAGEHAISASDVLHTAVQQPNVEYLNLEAVGVKRSQQGIQVNGKLQTSNPRIYACGEVIGGYPLAHIANYEAQVAVKNALFWPVFNVSYQAIPWSVFSDPELARVGLTEVQAKQHYGHDIRVLRQFNKTIERPQLGDPITEFCKVITQRNGTILGAHLVGPAAGDVIQAIAFTIKHRLKVKALPDLVYSSPTFAKISHQAAWQSSSRQSARRNLLETFFNLCRAWSS